MSSDIILEVRNISKSFPGIKALDEVSFSVRKGEVHALVGENGAGKSTLMHILCGVLSPDEGVLLLRGEQRTFQNPNHAISIGIGMVFQELSLVPGLSVAENIFANRQPVKSGNIINWSLLGSQTNEICAEFGTKLQSQVPVNSLTKEKQQVVEILKALSGNPDVLILDEPTSSLTALESVKLFESIKRLRNQGKSIIYISHNLDEIFTVADRVTILRDGRKVMTKPVKETSPDDLVHMMAGIELADMYGKKSAQAQTGDPFFKVTGLSSEPFFKDISFSLHKGEVVGLAGLVGAGRSALGRALFGCRKLDKGTICIDGQKVVLNSPAKAIKSGIAYASDDRKLDGLYLNKTVVDNFIANKLSKFTNNLGFLKKKNISAEVDNYIQNSNIVCRDVDQKVHNLSGGNQQKVLLGSWLTLHPGVLIIDEPTRGVDIRSRSQIYRSIYSQAANGAGVLLISSDLMEILGVCDRVLIFRMGSIVGDYQASEITGEMILAAASGLEK